jgi:hypothetical protein
MTNRDDLIHRLLAEANKADDTHADLMREAADALDAQPEQSQEAVAIPAGSEEFGDPRRAMTDDELQEFCIALSFEQDDYTEEVIRAVESRMLAKPLFFPRATDGDSAMLNGLTEAETSATASVAGLSAAAPAVEGLNSDTLWQLALDECDAFECDNDGRCIEEGMHFRNRAALLRFAALVIDRTDAERAAALTTHREHPAAQQERQEARHADIAQAIHYPDCWDQDAYPTLASALNELVSAFQCTNKDTHPLAAQAQKEAP